MTTALDGVLRRILESACEEHQANLSPSADWRTAPGDQTRAPKGLEQWT
jgi:hypothetical protein